MSTAKAKPSPNELLKQALEFANQARSRQKKIRVYEPSIDGPGPKPKAKPGPKPKAKPKAKAPAAPRAPRKAKPKAKPKAKARKATRADEGPPAPPLDDEGRYLLALYNGDPVDPKERERKRLTLLAKAKFKSRVLQAREDPDAFMEYCFRDSETGRYLQQAEIHRALQAAMATGDDTVNLFPRDHGKTTQLEGHAIWRLGNNVNLRVKFVCASDSKAVERLFVVIQHIKLNDRIRDVFPWLKPAALGDWCVPLDSTLHVVDGSLRRASEIKKGDVLWGWNSDEQQVAVGEVEHISASVLKPCVRVVTETGRSFHASADHRMLSGDGRYVRAGDLRKGDAVAVGRGMGAGQTTTVDLGDARLLGYLVGDGYTATKAGGPWFTNGTGAVLADFEAAVVAKGWGVSQYADRGSYRMLGVTRGGGSDPRTWLRSFGLLGKLSGDKRIPEALFRAGNGALIEFLRAYFATDGCFDESVARASWTTTSHGLASDLMRALRVLGVASRLTPDRVTGARKVGCAGWDAVELCRLFEGKPRPSPRELVLREAASRYEQTRDRRLRRSDLYFEGGVWRRRAMGDPSTVGFERVVAVTSTGLRPCVDFEVTAPTDTFLLDDGFIAHNTKHKIVVDRDYISRDASIEALGVLSTATGGRADLLFADDVVDRRNALELPKLRETVKVAWDADWSNLLEPTGQTIYTATPWHKADLTHKLQKNSAYRVLRFPVGDTSNPFAPIWEEKWPEEALRRRREKIGGLEYDRGFRLVALSGEYATVQNEWITYWEAPPDLGSLVVFQAFDVSSGKGADFFASVTVGVDPKTLDIFVLEAWHEKLTFLKRAEAVEEGARRWRPAAQGVEQETMGSLTQYLDETTLLSIIPLRPHLSKRLRLLGVTPLLERRQVKFNPSLDPGRLANAEEHGDLVGELCDFPLAPHDDLVDAFVHAIVLAQHFGLGDDDGLDLGVSVIGSTNGAGGAADLFDVGDGTANGNGAGTV